jgi:hypothetical protein
MWLAFAGPAFYLGAALQPFSAGYLSFIPLLGIVGLVIGIVVGCVQRKRVLFLFVFPFLLSEVFLTVGGLLRGQFLGTTWQTPSVIFAITQISAIVFVAYRGRKALVADFSLALFSLTYALFAWFIAGMSLSDTWL